MHTRKWSAFLAVTAACLFFTGCNFSVRNPLSDPKTSKPDTRLSGVWRTQNENGDVAYFHVGLAGGDLLPSVMRAHGVTHRKDGVLDAGNGKGNDILFFSTTLGANTFLNVTQENNKQIKLAGQKGKDTEGGGGYLLMKYKIEGDKLLTWEMDYDATKKAIADGKIKGLIKKQENEKEKGPDRVEVTETTENLARFVAGDGDSLFSKKVSSRLERVK